MSNLFIPILLGTAREGRESEKVARFIFKEAEKFGQFETEFLDVRNFATVGVTGIMPAKQAENWRETMKKADGLIIVSPEYNHGYPGELKIMLDKLRNEYVRKPVGICGVSSGILGGARMVEVLRITLIELQMVPIRNAVYFREIKTLFDEKGEIKDDAYFKRVQAFFDELVWYAKALKKARENS